MSLNTRFVSLNVCVRFFIFDSASFLLKLGFFYGLTWDNMIQFSLGESLTHVNHKWKHQTKNYLTKISKLTHEITWSWNQKFQDHVISWDNFEIKRYRKMYDAQTSVFRKLYRKVKIKGKRETWSKLENLIFQIT